MVDCDFLVLDEPTAGLPADEVGRLFEALRRLKDRGVGMIYVSHRLDEIFRIADRVAVLRDGQLVGEQPVAESTPEQLVRADHRPVPARPVPEAAVAGGGAVRIAVRGLTTAQAGPVDFAVQEGEILGLVGLRGAGQEQVGRALFGCQPHRGTVTLDGRPLVLATPRDAMAAGIGLVARDRTGESVASALSIRENAFLNPAAVGRGLFSIPSPRAEAERRRRWVPRSGCARTTPAWRSRGCRAGTSRRSSSGAGWPPAAGC